MFNNKKGGLNKLADKALKQFKTIKRTNGEKVWVTKSTCPKWIKEMIHDAHGDFMPDDIKYQFIIDALRDLSDCLCEDQDEIISEYLHQWCEGYIYNNERTAWLASNLRRGYYVDEMVAEFGGDYTNIFDVINLGIIKEQQEVYSSIINALFAQLKEVKS